MRLELQPIRLASLTRELDGAKFIPCINAKELLSHEGIKKDLSETDADIAMTRRKA